MPYTDIAASPNPLDPRLPTLVEPHVTWGQLYGASRGLAVAAAQAKHAGLLLLLTQDTHTAVHLEQESRFFSEDPDSIFVFPDWETLPYDVFSPHEDIVSQRLEILRHLPSLARGVLIVPVTTLMQRLAPRSFLDGYSLMLSQGDTLDRDAFRRHLEAAGYSHVSQVVTHGEYALRGSIIDLYPMGSRAPYRIDLLDEEVETIRLFDPESQLSRDSVREIRLLPAREFPIDEEAIKRFRQNFRIAFEGDPNASPIYRDVSQRTLPAGIEYYLPLFFDETATLFDYLPENTLTLYLDEVPAAAAGFEQDAAQRYEQRRHDRERPLLPPERLFLTTGEIEARLRTAPSIQLQRFKLEDVEAAAGINYPTAALPALTIQPRAAEPARALREFIAEPQRRVLLVAESPGRREFLLDALDGFGLRPAAVDDWREFLAADHGLAITVAPLDEGLWLSGLAVITEAQLFGERVRQYRRQRPPTRDADAVIRNLTDLHEGAPVVHEDHGVGRYLGLQKLVVGGMEAEFLTLEYAGGDKLYVPVASLQRVGRYTGADPEHAPLHKLGGEQWQKIKRRAAARARDVAAELLDIYARRAARQGHAFEVEGIDYSAFAAAFPFEETPDQQRAIDDVLNDLRARQPMDRVVCGDVGFGKTEVALRAAFVAAQNGKQVAVLVPTTLLAGQHLQTFRDRFADWPVRIESLSRFGSQKQQQAVLRGLSEGKVDIVIGTHKLLQKNVKFKDLGLVIVDEEHRFGVRHKERLKQLRAEVDMLTLTATPIPRTLNLSLSGLRDLSIIATPPMHRHAIKTFVNQWSDALIQEACARELKRGGQIYFLHNKVETIEQTTRQVSALLPGASVRIAHGQMRERVLEHTMMDFYHQRFSVLVCTTIIESGIDVPSANTIIINRADKLGLAQLHQIRGRVGRSHHRAYAYLIAPPRGAMTADAAKRLEAIESLEDLGVGFTLATHDLEIRGAGELLGEEQSGQIHEIGFTLYNDLLERAVRALRSGKMPELEISLDHGAEVDLGVSALLPDDYVPDVHMRLILYKRIAGAADVEALRELQVEMIDRFGLLPEPARNLFEITRLKLLVAPFGVTKVEAGNDGGRILFNNEPHIDPAKVIGLIQKQPQTYKLEGEDRLRFDLSMENLQARVNTVTELLNRLALKQAA